MKKLYENAIFWIVNNDSPEESDLDTIKSQTSTLLIADLFVYNEEKVTKDIINLRKKLKLI